MPSGRMPRAYNLDMRLTVSMGILAASLSAQSFDPKMPDAVPPAAGAVVERAPLRYIELQAGTGAAAKPGQEYTVHYTGWLRDGVKFDSSVDAGKPLKFVQGRRQVIAGWEMAFEGMKVGGKRRLFLPYALAYGENGRGKIPPKAELIFDVELLEARDVPPLVAAAELLLPFDDLEKQVLALAKAIPEEKYAWRPGPGVRSFKEVFLHIVYGNQLLLNVAVKSPSREELMKQIEQNGKGEQDPAGKEKIVGMLAESFASVRQTLEGVRSTAALTRDVDLFGKPAPMGGVLATIDTHIAEHLGQVIAYARVNGIVPPWSQPAPQPAPQPAK
jgi:uncharacterized damage-inducible protein DinB